MGNHEQEKIELIKKAFDFKNQKKYKEAIETLYKILEFQNELIDNVEILSQLGDLYVLIKSYDRALDQYQKVLSLLPDNEHCLQQCFEIYIKTSQLNKALKISSQMCEQNKNAKSYHNYLKTLILLDKKQDAVEIFNTLDEKIKMDSDVLYLISSISNDDKKEIMLKRILELDISHPAANIELAKMEFEKKNYDKVIPYCINIDEDNAVALFYLAEIEAIRKNYSQAISLYLKAIELDDEEHDFYINIARTYIDLSLFDEALIALKKSINMSVVKGNCADIDEKYFLAGWILIKKSEYSKAILNLNSIKKDSIYFDKAQILIQIINTKKSNTAAALTKLEEYFEKEEDNGILLDTLALCYKELKLTKKAIVTYKKALNLYPDSIYYTLELIDLLIDDKNYDEALELIEKFGQKYQNCATIYNSLARIYYRIKDYNRALDSIENYLKLDKNNAESYYFKGLILNDIEKYDEAKTAIYNAIQINPLVAKYYFQMARSYKELKEYENAFLYSKEAIEIDQEEINYKKQAYEISLLLGNEDQIKSLKKQLERSEKISFFKRGK